MSDRCGQELYPMWDGDTYPYETFGLDLNNPPTYGIFTPPQPRTPHNHSEGTPMITLGILLAHLVGDYLIQSHWMACEKTRHWWPAIAHGLTYTIPYALVTQSPVALMVIAGTHIVIDRFRLARHVVWLKNQLAPAAHRPRWEDAKATGYPSDAPTWLSVWLMFIADNTLHLLINTAAVVWL